MSDNIFINFIGKHFNDIKGKFQTQIRKLGFEFDHDVFYDTMLKCNTKFFDETALEEEMENYFWTAFKNNTMRELRYARNKNNEGEDTINEESLGTTEDDNENDDNIIEDYVKVSNMIIDEFGMDLYKLFSLHANGTQYKDLVPKDKINDIKYQFRKIRDYVRNNYKRK